MNDSLVAPIRLHPGGLGAPWALVLRVTEPRGERWRPNGPVLEARHPFSHIRQPHQPSGARSYKGAGALGQKRSAPGRWLGDSLTHLDETVQPH